MLHARPLPTLGLRGPERGTSMGPGRKEGVGPRGCQRSGQPAHERASVQGGTGGPLGPHPASERMRRGCCWGGWPLSTA